jgi:protein-S-isoprenylcysteine O-methyltransferase Ste14
MDRYLRMTKREFSARSRLIALFFAGCLFLVLIPFGLAYASRATDAALHLPRVFLRWPNYLLGGALIAVGWPLAMWSILLQFTRGRGTPMPFMATQEFIPDGPFRICRNPMSLGTICAYLGVAVCLGSLSAIIFVLAFAAGLVAYIKFVEERELAARFGEQYEAYRKSTPFIFPRLTRRKE